MPYVRMADKLYREFSRLSDVTGHESAQPYSLEVGALLALRACERRLQNLAERECNGEGYGPLLPIHCEHNGRKWTIFERGWTDDDDEKTQRLENAAWDRAERAAKVLGVNLVRGSGDPRGAMLHIEFPATPDGYKRTMYFCD